MKLLLAIEIVLIFWILAGLALGFLWDMAHSYAGHPDFKTRLLMILFAPLIWGLVIVDKVWKASV